MSFVPSKGSYKNKRNIFTLNYLNVKDKPSRKVFSVDDPELYKTWCTKISATLSEYRQNGPLMLLSPEEQAERQRNQHQFSVRSSSTLGSTAISQSIVDEDYMGAGRA